MEATILNVADNGGGSLIVRVKVVDGFELINLNNVSYAGEPCIEIVVPVPISSKDAVQTLEDVIKEEVQTRLAAEKSRRVKEETASSLAEALNAKLIGMTFNLSKG